LYEIVSESEELTVEIVWFNWFWGDVEASWIAYILAKVALFGNQ